MLEDTRENKKAIGQGPGKGLADSRDDKRQIGQGGSAQIQNWLRDTRKEGDIRRMGESRDAAESQRETKTRPKMLDAGADARAKERADMNARIDAVERLIPIEPNVWPGMGRVSVGEVTNQGGMFRLQKTGASEISIGPGAVWAGNLAFYLWPGPDDSGVFDVSGLAPGVHLIGMHCEVDRFHGKFTDDLHPHIVSVKYADWDVMHTDNYVIVPIGAVEVAETPGVIIRQTWWWTQPILLTVYRKVWRDGTADGVLQNDNYTYSYHCSLALRAVGDPSQDEPGDVSIGYHHNIVAAHNTTDWNANWNGTWNIGDTTPSEIFL